MARSVSRVSRKSRNATDRNLCHGFVSRLDVARHAPVTITIDPPPRGSVPELGLSGTDAKRSSMFENLAHVVLLGATSGAKPQRLLAPALGLQTS